MQFILSFSVLYMLSAIIGKNMHYFTPDPKLICIRPPILYAILTFPHSVMGNKLHMQRNEQKLTLLAILFCIINQIVLVGTIMAKNPRRRRVPLYSKQWYLLSYRAPQRVLLAFMMHLAFGRLYHVPSIL